MALKGKPKSPEHRSKLLKVLSGTWERRPNRHKIHSINTVDMTGCCVTCGNVPLKLVKHRNNKKGYIRDQYLCWVGSLRTGEANVRYPNEALEMFNKADGTCAVCKKPLERKDMVLDHDHKSKLIRGFIHQNCNKGIGLFNDDPDALQNAIDYLRSSAIS